MKSDPKYIRDVIKDLKSKIKLYRYTLRDYFRSIDRTDGGLVYKFDQEGYQQLKMTFVKDIVSDLNSVIEIQNQEEKYRKEKEDIHDIIPEEDKGYFKRHNFPDITAKQEIDILTSLCNRMFDYIKARNQEKRYTAC